MPSPFFLPLQNKAMVLLLLISSTPFISPAAATTTESFMECFTNLTHSRNLLSTPRTAAYNGTLLSSAQNQRILLSPDTSKPSLIISAADETHVQAAVSCARSTNLTIRTRSGGHDYEGMSYSSVVATTPFITLDISALRAISFDTPLTTAWVQAGATVGEVYYAIGTKSPNLTFPAGICPTIGIGGHLSGGGIGTLTRKYGSSADNVLDARIVTADGQILDRQSMGEDLFWAIRGAASAGFGIVLAFKIRLVAVPPIVTAFTVVRTLRQNATQLVARWEQIAHRFDENLFVRVVAQGRKDSDAANTIQVNFNSYYLGRANELLAVAKKSFPELGLTAADCAEMSWLQSALYFNNQYGKPVETLLSRTPAFNSSFKGKSDFVKTPIGEKGLEKIWTFMLESDKDENLILILEPFGGKMSSINENEIAFPHRRGNLYNVQYYLPWLGKAEGVTQRNLEWMRKLYAFMAPFVSGNPRAAYYNYKDLDLGRNAEGRKTSYEGAMGWGTKYFKGNFERLATVKGRVDPSNFFWNEQSVPPLKPVGVL